jgi:hypothetical protein
MTPACRSPSSPGPATAIRPQFADTLSSSWRLDCCPFAATSPYQTLGWSITCSWLARVFPAELSHVIAELTALPQLRLCVSLIGDANLGFSVLASSVRDIGRFEQTLGKRLPGLHLLESFLHLRSLKRMGWMLNPDGRCTAKVIVPTVFSP